MKKIIMICLILGISINLFAKECAGNLKKDLERCVKLDLMYKNCQQEFNNSGNGDFIETAIYARLVSCSAIGHILQNHKNELSNEEIDSLTAKTISYLEESILLGKYVNLSSDKLTELVEYIKKDYGQIVESLKI